MKAVFADTSYFVALAGPNDSLHAQAVEWSERWLGPIVTTDYVLAETGSLLSRSDDRVAFVNLVRELKSDPFVRIEILISGWIQSFCVPHG
jgi:predicted nucleic acid-binding protein